MKIARFSLAIAFWAVCIPLAADAQAGSAAAVIEYASGDDVTVIRNAKRVAMGDPFGVELFAGDQVQTGRGVFLEMRLLDGGAVVKLAENTTFVLQRVDSGQTAIALIYGRIRAKVEKLAGTDSFSVTSPSAIAGVRGTDFGMDIIAPRGTAITEPVTTVYCFEGAVDVTAYIDTSTSAAESLEPVPKKFSIAAGEMVTVSQVDEKREAQKAELPEPIRAFWAVNDFSEGSGASLSPATSPATAPATATAPASDAQGSLAVAEAYDDGYSSGYGKGFLEGQAGIDARIAPEGFMTLAEGESLRRSANAQRGGLIGGSIVAIAGAALSGLGLILRANGDAMTGEYLLQSGVILTGISMPFLVIALFSGK